MKELKNVSFEGCLLAGSGLEAPVLCVFADTSQETFGTCASVRQKRNDDVYNVKFIAAKSRVPPPLKQLTIPRLELQAAVLASFLAKSTQEESRIQFGNVYFFTDSTITLAWIQSPSRSFKPFVSSRIIGEIQSDTDPSQWRHIPGEDNVADDLSRGITINELSGRWMKGPEFLRLLQEQWPNGTPPPPQEKDVERRRTKLAVSVVALKAVDAVDPSTFSNWRRLIRVTARIRRLAEKLGLEGTGKKERKGFYLPKTCKGRTFSA